MSSTFRDSCEMIPRMAEDPTKTDLRFAANVKRLRELNGWSKAELVRALNDAGWESAHQTTITRLENGERPARLGEAELIARVFGRTIKSMMLDESQASVEDYIADWKSVVRDSYNEVVEHSGLFEGARRTLDRFVEEAREIAGRLDNEGDPTRSASLWLAIRGGEPFVGLNLEGAVESGRRADSEGHQASDHPDRYFVDDDWLGE